MRTPIRAGPSSRRAVPRVSRSSAGRCGHLRPRRHARGTGEGGHRSTTSSSLVRRTDRSTITTASRRRCRRGGYGPPPGYTQPDATGVGHAPFELTALRSVDPPHGWGDVHAQWNGGRMDGFYKVAALRTGSGDNAIPYYTARELPFYYSLFRDSGLCANYFCSLLGPTWPNRFYLMSGTSGGITTNGLWGYGIFDSSSWPIILDLLDEGGVSWKIYYIGSDGVEVGDTDNVAVFWSRWAHDPRTTATLDDYLEDCAAERFRTSPGSSRASRCSSTSTPMRTSASAWASSSRSSRRSATRACGSARRSSSRTTSTAASSTTLRRRRWMRTGSASGCRCG